MYLIKFDEEGKKISAVPLILADDWGGVEKLKNEGYIEVSDEDWNYYTGNCGDGDNDTGYIKKFENTYFVVHKYSSGQSYCNWIAIGV